MTNDEFWTKFWAAFKLTYGRRPLLWNVLMVVLAVVALLTAIKIWVLFTATTTGNANENLEISIFGSKLGKLFSDLDILGFLVGLVGMFFSAFLAIMIQVHDTEQADKQANEYKEKITELNKSIGEIRTEADEQAKAYKERIDKLNTATSQIVESSAAAVVMLEKFTSLETIRGYKDLIGKIGEVINYGLQSNNTLSIVNHTAAFGYFLSFDLDNVLSNMGRTRDYADTLTCEEFYKEWQILKNYQQKQVYSPLTELTSKSLVRPLSVKYVSLKTTDNGKSAFTDFYLDQTLQNVQVVFFNSDLEPKLTVRELLKRYKISDALGDANKKIYLVSQGHVPGMIAKNVDEARDHFRDYLIRDQFLKCAKLKEVLKDLNNGYVKIPSNEAKFEFVEAAGVSVQMFVARPSEPAPGNMKAGKCLFMFVNQDTIGQTKDESIAFYSEQTNIVDVISKMKAHAAYTEKANAA